MHDEIGQLDTRGPQRLTIVTFRYHLLKRSGPEFELNDTIWPSGMARGGKDLPVYDNNRVLSARLSF